MTKQQLGTIGLWTLTALTALGMGAAGLPKVLGNPQMVQGFAAMGFPSWFLPLIGTLELAGAVGLLIRRLSGLAALCLSMLMVGAVGTHVVHHDTAHAGPAVLFLVITLGLAFARRASLLELLPPVASRRHA